MATVEIELELVGSAEGVPVEIRAHGSLNTDAGQLALDLHPPRRLLLFDPAMVTLSLFDVLAFIGTQQEPDDPDADVHMRSRTDLYDENGRDTGGWRVLAALERKRHVIRLDGQLLDCRLHIEPGERVVALDSPWTVVAQPLEPEGVLITGAWDARTARGSGYRGVTTRVLNGWTREWVCRKAVGFQWDLCVINRIDSQSGETFAIDASFSTNHLAPAQE